MDIKGSWKVVENHFQFLYAPWTYVYVRGYCMLVACESKLAWMIVTDLVADQSESERCQVEIPSWTDCMLSKAVWVGRCCCCISDWTFIANTVSVCLQHLYSYQQGGPKIKPSVFVITANIGRFSTFVFTSTLGSKFAVEWSFNISPLLKLLATLPCEIFMLKNWH